MRPWRYSRIYRRGAPWDRVGVAPELVSLVESGRVDPRRQPRAIDLGCGTGANAVYLAERGFTVTGVDFTPVAVERARERAERAGVSKSCTFVEGDLTSAQLAGVSGSFDFLLDYSTLDDLPRRQRKATAETVFRLSRPGSVFFLWCFSVWPHELKLLARKMSRLVNSQMYPGEENDLFADHFSIERLPDPPRPQHAACFLLVRR